MNSPDAQVPCMLPVPGEVITEIDAIRHLTGAQMEMIAAGEVCGAEGCMWLAVKGGKEQVEATEDLMRAVASVPGFELQPGQIIFCTHITSNSRPFFLPIPTKRPHS